MKRFRFTLIAVCLVLLYMGYGDLSLYLRNQTPAEISIEQLIRQGPPQEWLHVTGGYLNLDEAISTSGSVELDALLVPLTPEPEQERYEVLVETHDTQLLDLFKTYHFKLDTLYDKEAFREENARVFFSQRDITGMLQTSLIADNNLNQLKKLARAGGLDIPEEVFFLSEGKTPPFWRGFFFLAVALAGMAKVLFGWKKPSGDAGPK